MIAQSGKRKSSAKGLSILLLTVGVGLVLILAAYCGYRVYTLSRQQEQLKKDYSIVNSVSFGLLSVDLWRHQIVTAATVQVDEYRLTPSQVADLKKEIDRILHGLVDHAFVVLDKPQKSLGGKIKKMAIDALVNKRKLQEEVPGFSKKIMEELTRPSSYHRLANIADTAIAQMGRKTYDSSIAVTETLMDSVFRKYKVQNKNAFEKQNAADLIQVRRETYNYAFGILGCILVILALWWLLRNRPEFHLPLYLLSVLSALILLVVGLTTTMIEIDARIASMDFHLLGQDISFKNQELFFQSKSIVDVVVLLLKTGKIDAQIVGILILVFSILFPVMKLLSAGLSLMSEQRWAKNKIVHYFAFKSGKWSMADVMVVAILMTYIGFNGIVESTLSDLNLHTESITSITTNNTSIQPGYIVFIAFVLYGFVLSGILEKITNRFTKV